MVKRSETIMAKIQMFHVFVLPALWFFTMTCLWIAYMNVGGDKGMVPVVLGWIGWWLGWFGMPGESIIPFLLLDSLGGVLAMALIGFIQDVLRVSKRVVILYPAIVVPLAFYAAVSDWGFPHSGGDFIRSGLALFCISIYAVSFLSTLLALGCWIARKWRGSQFAATFWPAMVMAVVLLIVCLGLAKPWSDYRDAIHHGQFELLQAEQYRACGGKVEGHDMPAPYAQLFTCFGLIGKRQYYAIERVTMDGTKVGDDVMHRAGWLKHLKYLSLKDTNITDHTLGFLAQLPEVEELHLQGAKVTIAAVEGLRKSLPNAKVYFSDNSGTDPVGE